MNVKRYRPQDDIPDEIISLHILQDYRKLLLAKEQLTEYAHKLERIVKKLQEELSVRTNKNRLVSEKLVMERRKAKHLKVYNDFLLEQIKQYEKKSNQESNGGED